jgi:alkylation response protein AidB-like acyl-CoA dehydrogenase
MDFELTYEYSAEQQEFRKEVAAWVEANAPKRPPQDEDEREDLSTDNRRSEEARAWSMKLGEKGWFRPCLRS